MIKDYYDWLLSYFVQPGHDRLKPYIFVLVLICLLATSYTTVLFIYTLITNVPLWQIVLAVFVSAAGMSVFYKILNLDKHIIPKGQTPIRVILVGIFLFLIMKLLLL